MADPIIIETPLGVWTKVATSVKSALIHKVTNTRYLHTHVDTGNPAPTGLSLGIVIYENCLDFKDSEDSDIYIYCDKVAGRVIVDV